MNFGRFTYMGPLWGYHHLWSTTDPPKKGAYIQFTFGAVTVVGGREQHPMPTDSEVQEAKELVKASFETTRSALLQGLQALPGCLEGLTRGERLAEFHKPGVGHMLHRMSDGGILEYTVGYKPEAYSMTYWGTPEIVEQAKQTKRDISPKGIRDLLKSFG